MKILFLFQDFPYPPRNGVHLTPYNLIDYQARRHDCFVLTLGGPIEPERVSAWEKKYERLRVLGTFPTNSGWTLGWKRLRSLLRGHAVSCARWSSDDFARALTEVLRQQHIDVVHVDMINLTQYADLLRAKPCVFAMNDASSRLYEQVVPASRGILRKTLAVLQGWQLRRFERKMAARADTVRLVSHVDADYLQCLAPSANIQVIGVTLDEAFFDVAPADVTLTRPQVMLGGFMNSEQTAAPVIDFVLNGWPLIRKHHPDATLQIAARNMDQVFLDRIADTAGLVIHRWLPDYLKALEEAHVCLYLDAVGTGLKNRVIQAMGAGRPVVATTVAFESIPVVDGVSGLICADASAAARQVLELLGDGAKRLDMGTRARALVRDHFAPEVVGKQWEVLYQETIARRAERNGSHGEKPADPASASITHVRP